MATTINNYADLQNLLNTFVAANSLSPGLAPHAVFWNNLTYDEFITQDVPGVSGFRILVPGSPETSNIILALSGAPNTPFSPDGEIGQMPQPNAPYNAETPQQTDVIAALTDWIARGCPNTTA
ncbi:hypothetical protein IDJ75_14685 [Mucilaginibacter rigui]|uniref:Uncharacterized protein n=1 Tax=Mucilaginibacter rigui TaxID=534635 RepID=A0ABR7X7H6_9SPHI|nr:hypothetical protein [Mucilaginibacter rigui]MBD1386530.1 hypothetical protein [Mucilaginibacter rigui]